MSELKHLMNPRDLSLKEYEDIFRLCESIISDPSKFQEKAKGKILATLFFEPSTRTRLSFETAMLRLGGSVIGFSDGANCSAVKGETVADTLKVVSRYADVIAIRHPRENAPQDALSSSLVPVINAGDGGNQHPTQTLADLVTIRSELGHLDNLTIGMCGDLKFGRTVHSLISAMTMSPDNRFVLISPSELMLPEYIKDNLRELGVEFRETTDLEGHMGELDILYMTRVQRERFSSMQEYERLKDSYILDSAKMKIAKKDMIVMHPLPRVNEISVDVDSDPRACYFPQTAYGMYARMALIMKLLNLDKQ